jgi:hypothetical protein
MIDPDELSILLARLKQKAPDLYRHLIGVIKAALNIAKKI